MKFKVGFTMSAETLFSIMAKVLPIEDLSVEEVPENLPKIGKVEKIPQLSGPKNRLKPQRVVGRRFLGPSLEGGANKVVMDLLSDGKPHRAAELKPLFKAAGYSGAGVGSRLDKLREQGVVHQPEFGLWQIGEAKKAARG